MTKITVLIDNQPDPERPSLETEHGLSFYIQTDKSNILLDVGASDKFLNNAGQLGIDIADVDCLVLSHAHNDHTGGLACFLQHNSRAQIYLSSNINAYGYYSNRRRHMRDISIDYGLVQTNMHRIVTVTDNIRLTPSVEIISRIPVSHSIPQANRTLLAGEKPDNFSHEMALLVREGDRHILLSSCTHLGLLNTLEACAPIRPDAFIGGLHLIDSDDNNRFETDEDYTALSAAIRSQYPGLQIYTGHCTGSNAKSTLSHLLSGQFHTFHTCSHFQF